MSDAHRRPLAPVLIPNFELRYSGVSSATGATIPHVSREVDVDLIGRPAGPHNPRYSFLSVLVRAWGAPSNVPFRIWHSRRNIELIAGIVMRDLLRQPLRVVFTSAAQRRHRWLTRWLMSRADSVVAPSSDTARFVPGPSVIIRHGVDCEVFKPALDRERAWAERGLGGRRGIGVFGRVRQQKGTDLFVDALIELLPRYPDYVAIVVGLTKPSQRAFLDSMRARVAAAKLERRLLFLGERPFHELPLWIASVSVCVCPQRHEGFGLVPLEAAASGTAVVASRVGAAEQIIQHGETGILVEPGQLGPLTLALETLMQDEALAKKLGGTARREVQARFNITAEASGHIALYDSLWRQASFARNLSPRLPA
jgi:mannosyltransferase